MPPLIIHITCSENDYLRPSKHQLKERHHFSLVLKVLNFVFITSSYPSNESNNWTKIRHFLSPIKVCKIDLDLIAVQG